VVATAVAAAAAAAAQIGLLTLKQTTVGIIVSQVKGLQIANIQNKA